MPRSNRSTGEGDEYTASEEEAVAEAVAEAYGYWEEEGHEGEPDEITVEARIEWAGEVDAKNGGMRSTKLDGLSTSAMRRVREATRTRASYTAVSTDAKLQDLARTRRGREIFNRVVPVNPRTARAWVTGDREPNGANRRRIDQAYAELRGGDPHKVTQALTDALQERYGSKIRFRNIRRFDF